MGTGKMILSSRSNSRGDVWAMLSSSPPLAERDGRAALVGKSRTRSLSAGCRRVREAQGCRGSILRPPIAIQTSPMLRRLGPIHRIGIGHRLRTPWASRRRSQERCRQDGEIFGISPSDAAPRDPYAAPCAARCRRFASRPCAGGSPAALCRAIWTGEWTCRSSRPRGPRGKTPTPPIPASGWARRFGRLPARCM